jgi:hypothetical protein
MLVFFKKKETNMTEQESRYSEWRTLIEDQEKSDMNQEDFCKMKGISVAKLQYYRKKTRTTPATPRKYFSEIKFNNVEQKTPLPTKEICLILQNGIQCFFPAEMDMQKLKNWMETLLSC